MAFRGRNLAVSSKNHYNSGKKTIRNMGKANVYGNPKVYHLVIEKCTTSQSLAKLHLIQQTSK